jgi:3-deoxy-D-manno-octulosonic acid (KDO) 8-phosphate synthase
MAMRIAEKLIGITEKLQIPYVFRVRLKKPIVQE